MNQIRGRLFGRNVSEVVFRAQPDEDLFIGELLVGIDEITNRRYLIRVVDISYGSDQREPLWAQRIAGRLLGDDSGGDEGFIEEHFLYEPSRRSYQIAECRCLGYITPDATSFQKPKSLPSQFSQVVSPEPSDFNFLASRMGDLNIGNLRSGEQEVDFEVGISGNSFSSHIGIFATTGMGKSNLLQVLAAQVMLQQGRYGLLVIDPHGEHHQKLAQHPWASSTLKIYSSRKAVPNASTLRVGLGELSIDDLRVSYQWSHAQEEAIFELERHYGKKGLSWLSEFCSIQDLSDFRENELSSRVAPATLQIIHRRAKRITGLSIIASDSSISVGDSIIRDLQEGKVVVLDLSALDSTEELMIASYFSRRVLDEWSSQYLENPSKHSRMPVVGIVLEEAQRVLGNAKSKGEGNIFPRIAREGRKFKVGLCAISQQPKLIDDELLSQFNTFLILGLSDEKDRNILRSSAKQDLSALSKEIQTLMPGEALVVNLEAPFAIPAKIQLFSQMIKHIEPLPIERKSPPNVSALMD